MRRWIILIVASLALVLPACAEDNPQFEGPEPDVHGEIEDEGAEQE